MTRLFTIFAVMLAGCQTSKKQPPLLMDSGEQAAIATAPQPPRLPPAPTGPEVRAPLPPTAVLSWPALLTAKAYRVDYGVSMNSMTNSVITSTTNCHILGSFVGQKHFYRVREINGRAYGKQVSSGTIETR